MESICPWREPEGFLWDGGSSFDTVDVQEAYFCDFAPRLGVFDVASDGQRFLVFGDTSSFNGTPLFIVQNWDANLAQH
ncbi:MAG: hypothetical protein WBU20_23820 [Candidatus Acidiferrum sp.]